MSTKLYIFLAKSKHFLAGKEKAQGLVEYALILALIAVVVIAAVTTLGGKISDMFTSLAAAI